MNQENEPLNTSRLSNGSKNGKKNLTGRNERLIDQNASTNPIRINEPKRNLNTSRSSNGSEHSHRKKRLRSPSTSSKSSRHSVKSASRTKNDNGVDKQTGFVVLNDLTEAEDESEQNENASDSLIADEREQIKKCAKLICNNNRNPENRVSDLQVANSLVSTISSLNLYKPPTSKSKNPSLPITIFKATSSCIFFMLNLSVDIYLAVYYYLYHDADQNSKLYFGLTLGFVLLPGMLMLIDGFVDLIIKLFGKRALSITFVISQLISSLTQSYYFF